MESSSGQSRVHLGSVCIGYMGDYTTLIYIGIIRSTAKGQGTTITQIHVVVQCHAGRTHAVCRAVRHGDVAAAFHLNVLLGNPGNVADIGPVGLCVATAGDIGNLLLTAINAVWGKGDISYVYLIRSHSLAVNGRIPGYHAAVRSQIDIFVQCDLESYIIHLGRNIGAIAFYCNRTAQIGRCTCMIVCRKPKAAVTEDRFYGIDIRGHGSPQHMQLIFRGRPA